MSERLTFWYTASCIHCEMDESNRQGFLFNNNDRVFSCFSIFCEGCLRDAVPVE